VIEALRRLVVRRAAREPLQHLLGTAVLGPVVVAVGPGVFIPRPETELLFEWGLRAVADVPSPLVVDLCTGTGALALAVAASRPDAVVHAVEADSGALSWARRNIEDHVAVGGTPVTLHAADVRWNDLLIELESHVDLVLCNPPYVPDGTRLPPEVTDWDPPGAVFGGPDGLEIIRAVIAVSAGLLRYGGHLAIEHDDTHGEVVPALLRRRRVLTDVEEHHDLNGRPRFATARRMSPDGSV
jgi:release factor glutamine methyltransferase